ncbi:MAG: LptF/LptG family permease [Bacteroidales bacterium]|nr:LptF/LptG family permease [Bacteroidales bacterium]
MKRLHKFILKSYFGPLVATFFISLFILLMQFLWRYIDDLAGKGLDWTVIAELILYASARLVPMALPLAILLSSIMTFGNLGENYELTAVKSAGVSLQKFMSPLIILTILISISAFFYSEYIIPYSNLKSYSLLYDVKNQRPELQIKEGVFYNGIDGYSIKIAKKDYKTNLLQNLMIYDHSNNKENVEVTVADSGYMKMTADERNLILTLYNGYSYEEVREAKQNRRKKDKQYPHQRRKFEKQTVVFELTGLDFSRTDEDLFKNNFQMLNLRQLVYAEDSLTEQFQKQIYSFKVNTIRSNYFKKDESFNLSLNDTRKKNHNRKPRNLKPSNKKLNLVDIDSGYTRKSHIRINKKDSILQTFLQSPDKDVLIDSLLAYQDQSTQEGVIEYALNYARAAQNNISSTRKQFNRKAEKIRRHQIEWHRKFALSFACLVFFFIGAPFGAIIRKGGFGTPVVISVLFFILYYIISIAGEKFAREGVMPAYFGMWLSSIILMPLGIFLTYKATTDSVILNMDTYLLFFKKIFKRLSKKSK